MGIKSRHVLGIDASTHTLAFCFMDNGVPLWWGEIDLGTGKDMHTRLGEAFTSIQAILDQALAGADHVTCCIESAIKINNIKTTINLSYMYGIIIGAISARGIVVKEVSPITWQNYIGNKSLTPQEKKKILSENVGMSKSTVNNKIRAFRKQRTINWVKETFDIDIKSDNVSDSFGISYYQAYHG